ncbi:IclR family transcriptional regulator [Pelagibacterium flavum]|uniref:IclR family transcriptional regulator n=1 Tax=Pelagibacterium flavum TaxID=2984530 RepID=A0ABY6IJY2_9HYPH|nr:IclR family transcriptional regulator [Pelagibacterium sp. YIM 151497]UYQ70906.1 IclR family transcriptional regulator [Pelagibacterium sp. YIM 151497]
MRYEELRNHGQRWTLDDTEPTARSLVPAVHKAIQILSFINQQPRAVTLSAIIENTGITKSHCFSILRTLVHHGWLHFNPDLKTYELGTGILRDVSSITLEASPFFVANSIVQDLPLKTDTSCILSEPHPDGGFVVVGKANAPGKLEISYPVGHHYPRDTSAHMKALLSWVEVSEVEAWLADWTPVSYTSQSATSMQEVWRQLELTRERGYALSIDEFTVGISAIALPIFDFSGQVVYILDCVGLTPDITQRQDTVAEALIEAVGEIHRAIGGLPPAGFPAVG